MIQYGRQEVTEDDIKAIVDVLRSDFLTQGPKVPEFELGLINYTGAKYATVVNSATSALHLACCALGLRKGDIVWTVPTTFVASANCALYCGATIDFVDIDPTTFNISIEELKIKLKFASSIGKLPKIIIPVHLTGEPCDMISIKKLSKEFGFKIIEDASHAVGGKYDNSAVGKCEYSDITVFSFHPVKLITSGEGGAALTNCKYLNQKIKLLRSHGITRDPKLMETPNESAWYYEQIDLGFNYRMTEIQAALGLSQLDRLDKYVRIRHQLAERYDDAFVGTQISIPARNPNNISALHLYVIQVDNIKHKKIFQFLRSKNIGVNLHYIPVHTHPFYRKLGFNWGSFPNAEDYYKRSISLPINPSLKLNEQDYVINQLKHICNDNL